MYVFSALTYSSNFHQSLEISAILPRYHYFGVASPTHSQMFKDIHAGSSTDSLVILIVD